MKKTAEQIAQCVLEKIAISLEDLDQVARVAKRSLIRPPRKYSLGGYSGGGPSKQQAFMLNEVPRNIFVRGNSYGGQGERQHLADLSAELAGAINSDSPVNLNRYYTNQKDRLDKITQGIKAQGQLTPLENRYANYLTQAHELDEKSLLGAKHKRIASHVSPDVVFRESNRMATLPPELNRLKLRNKGMRAAGWEEGLYSKINEKYPKLQLGEMGDTRINRRLRRFLTEDYNTGGLNLREISNE
jgi:hypothetical protein